MWILLVVVLGAPGYTGTAHTSVVGPVSPPYGDGHVHLIRTDGFVEARSITVQLIPAGAARRIDADPSPHWGF